jgi:peptidoglycan/LPS O-acetylase OafA/YrhL
MLPWLIAVLTLIPLYKIIFLYSRGLPQEEWYSYFHVYQRTGTDLVFFANNPAQNWLWFLPVLFLFQLLYYLLAKSKIFSFTLSLRSAILLTFILSVLYCLTITALHSRGWYHSALLHFKKERLLVYFLGFLLGSQFYSQAVFDYKTNKRSIILNGLLLLGSLVIYTLIFLNFRYNLEHPGDLNYLFDKKTDTVLFYCSLIISMIGITTFFFLFFKKWFNIRNRILDELNRNSYPLYIIHVIVLGIIAIFFLEIKTTAMVKYILLIILTFVASNLIITGYRQIAVKFFNQGK